MFVIAARYCTYVVALLCLVSMTEQSCSFSRHALAVPYGISVLNLPLLTTSHDGRCVLCGICGTACAIFRLRKGRGLLGYLPNRPLGISPESRLI